MGDGLSLWLPGQMLPGMELFHLCFLICSFPSFTTAMIEQSSHGWWPALGDISVRDL
jgi:hypothetical protein